MVGQAEATRLAPVSTARNGTTGCVVIGVHGGAGASTLVRLLDPFGSGAVVEWKQGMAPQLDRIPLLVARSTAYGTAVAASYIVRWRPDLHRPVLVLVADVPFAMPPIVRYRRRALSSQVTAVIEVPYFFRLRDLDDPAQALDRRGIASAGQRLRRQLHRIGASMPEVR